MEVRGIGIVNVKPVPDADIVLVIDLVEPGSIERFPLGELKTRLLGVECPLLRLAPFEASAPIKLALGLARPQAK
jgi:HPr kinase/phosphorylase